MIQILIPTIREDISGVLASIEANTMLPHVVTVLREGNSYAEAVNGAELTGDWIFLAADDVRFHPGWDTEAMDCHNITGMMVIGTNDLHHPEVVAGRGSTHWFVKKEYLDTYGGTMDRSYPVLFNYKHNYVDAEFIETAKAHKQFISCSKSVVEHMHPAWGLGEMDEAYQKNIDTSAEDALTFESRKHLWQGYQS
jgi:hypothetical protein